jgi:hypothetical protein
MLALLLLVLKNTGDPCSFCHILGCRASDRDVSFTLVIWCLQDFMVDFMKNIFFEIINIVIWSFCEGAYPLY